MNVSGINVSMTVHDVRAILDTKLPDVAVQAALEGAKVLVRDQLGTSIPQDTRDVLVRYLAAHFCTLQRPRPASQSIRGVSESYQGQTTIKLKSSFYGQIALTLDPTGTLKNWDNADRTVQFLNMSNTMSGSPYLVGQVIIV